jgi:hypothetical protein
MNYLLLSILQPCDNPICEDNIMWNKNKITLIALTTSFLGFNAAVVNAAEEVSVELRGLEVIRQQEKTGDELYFSVTEIPYDTKSEKGKFRLPKYYQVPNFPSHWLSKYANKIHDVTLWKKVANTCESTDVIFSLVEQDVPPWNLDDLLGSVKLEMRCENGKMTAYWEIPNSKITARVPHSPNAFFFTGDGAEYHGTFKIEHNKNAVITKEKQMEPLPMKQPIPIFP